MESQKHPGPGYLKIGLSFNYPRPLREVTEKCAGAGAGGGEQ